MTLGHCSTIHVKARVVVSAEAPRRRLRSTTPAPKTNARTPNGDRKRASRGCSEELDEAGVRRWGRCLPCSAKVMGLLSKQPGRAVAVRPADPVVGAPAARTQRDIFARTTKPAAAIWIHRACSASPLVAASLRLPSARQPLSVFLKAAAATLGYPTAPPVVTVLTDASYLNRGRHRA